MRRRPLLPATAALALGAATVWAGVGASPAHASAARAFSGYSTGAVAAPLELDVYEPTIPLPATPQGEVELAYSKALADSSGSRARASLLWPGDAVGEGFKVIADTVIGPNPLTANGYPAQANAQYPGSSTSDAQEPLPGAVMRAKAGEKTTRAQSGWSTDCDTTDHAPPASSDPAAGCTIPTALAKVTDAAGLASQTQVDDLGDAVVATARASADDVSLVGGLVTVTGVVSHASSRSDGKRTTGVAQASYGDVTLGGQRVRLGPDGAVLPGQTISLPGLPADPNQALSQLGLRFSIPKPSYDREGPLLTSSVAALVLEVDTGVLRNKVSFLPWGQVGDTINGLPDQLGQIKSALGAAVYLAPRLVITLGGTTTSVNTAQGITFPPLPQIALPGGGAAAPTVGTPGGTSGVPAVSGSTVPPSTVADVPSPLSLRPVSFPGRFHMPLAAVLGTLLVSALVAGGLRRLSGALIMAGPGPAGTASLPDLRKA